MEVSSFHYDIQDYVPHFFGIIFLCVPETDPFGVVFDIGLVFIFFIVNIGSPSCICKCGFALLFLFYEKDGEVVTFSHIKDP